MCFAGFLFSPIGIDHVNVVIKVRLDFLHAQLDEISHTLLLVCHAFNSTLLHAIHDSVEDLGLELLSHVLVNSPQFWQAFHIKVHISVRVFLELFVEFVFSFFGSVLDLTHASKRAIPHSLLVLKLTRIVEKFL